MGGMVMKEKPAYENYPVSEEEMCKRYKSWMQVLALYVVMAYDTGKEMGGEAYVEKMKEKFHAMGQKSEALRFPAGGHGGLQRPPQIAGLHG